MVSLDRVWSLGLTATSSGGFCSGIFLASRGAVGSVFRAPCFLSSIWKIFPRLGGPLSGEMEESVNKPGSCSPPPAQGGSLDVPRRLLS